MLTAQGYYYTLHVLDTLHKEYADLAIEAYYAERDRKFKLAQKLNHQADKVLNEFYDVYQEFDYLYYS